MATSPSYLQALPKDEAIAFITSLQNVREHLSQELQWFNQQVQQKNVQLQGVQTLLLEASALGLVTLNPDVTSDLASVAPSSSSITEVVIPIISDSDSSLIATPSKPPSTVQLQTNGQKHDSNLKAKPDTQSSTNTKISAAQTKQTKPSPKPTGKKSQPVHSSDLRQLLKAEFQAKTFTDAVAEILDAASKPLHLDDLLDQMYGELPDKTFQRAKVSLANVLSTGTGKGRWKSVGKGFYTGNRTATV